MSDRSWPLPTSPWVMRMRWSKLLFAHWALDHDEVRRHLPDGVEVDMFGGRAWVGVVPFEMTNIAPRLMPPLPGLSRFPELNLRTYVVRDGKPGVWFWSLDATNPIAVRVARLTFNLPYMDADMTIDELSPSHIQYRSHRTHRGEPSADFVADYHPTGESFLAQPGTIEHWLTSRYCLYCGTSSGRIRRGEILHSPWVLSKANCEIETNTMADGLGLKLTGEPHLLYAEPVDVRAWWASRCPA